MRYYARRPDRDGQIQERPGFDANRDEINRDQVRAEIAERSGDYSYRLMISPGETLDDAEIREVTREAMTVLEVQGVRDWTAYAHTDQTEHPHAHVIFSTDAKLERADLEAIREASDLATARILEQHQALEIEREPEPEQTRDRERDGLEFGL